jgi:hypothetical protein
VQCLKFVTLKWALAKTIHSKIQTSKMLIAIAYFVHVPLIPMLKLPTTLPLDIEDLAKILECFESAK